MLEFIYHEIFWWRNLLRKQLVTFGCQERIRMVERLSKGEDFLYDDGETVNIAFLAALPNTDDRPSKNFRSCPQQHVVQGLILGYGGRIDGEYMQSIIGDLYCKTITDQAIRTLQTAVAI